MTKRFIFLLLHAFIVLGLNAEVLTGSCGTNLTYNLNTSTGVLKIEGSGKMKNYEWDECDPPWYDYIEAISKVVLSESVTSIGDYAFFHCNKLSSISIPNKVTSIGKRAFSYSGITSIKIPNSVKNIGNAAFSSCTELSSLEISNGVESIGMDAFQYCENLTSVTIPNSVTSIGEFAFYECISLKSIELPEGITTIEDDTFCNCSSLTSVTIPSTITCIREGAFEDCRNLEFFYCRVRRAPLLEDDVFKNIDLAFATLYVPDESVNGYSKTAPWNEFGAILPLSQSPESIVSIEVGDEKQECYDISGRKQDTPQCGISIIDGKKRLIK